MPLRRLLSILLIGCLVFATTGGAKAQDGGPVEPQVGEAVAALPGTGFTYQGELRNGGSPVTATCDFQFGLYDALTLGAQQGVTQTVTTGVANGRFTVVLNSGAEFGARAFDGSARWLATSVRCPTGGGSYNSLSPRQPLTAAPLALALPGLRTEQIVISPNIIGGHISNNVAGGVYGATISGGGQAGYPNAVTNIFSTIGGGRGNTVSGGTGTVGGGAFNSTTGVGATIGGGIANVASGTGAFVGGGGYNGITVSGITVSGNTAAGDASVIGGGYGNTVAVTGTYGVIGGGITNTVSGLGATVAGGGRNTASGDSATIGGGHDNTASQIDSVIGGGSNNVASNSFAVVGGGELNLAGGSWATIGGGSENVVTATADYGTIGGGAYNTVAGYGALVGGGTGNTASATSATVGGGESNAASGVGAFVGGGYTNAASGAGAVVGGGGWDGTWFAGNTAAGTASTIGGGLGNVVTTTALYGTVGGGITNTVSGLAAVVPGGQQNSAAGNYSFAAGYGSTAGFGSFVWTCGACSFTSSSDNDQVVMNAQGGFWFGGRGTGSPTGPTGAIAGTQFISTSTGAYLSTVGVWTDVSDRNAKMNFAPVSVLDALLALPVQSWQYKLDDANVRHIGPTAQDFYAAFGVGADDTHLAALDTSGVALAAIQELATVVEAKDAQIAALAARVAALEQGSGGAPSSNTLQLLVVLALGLVAGGGLTLGAFALGKRQR